MAEKQDYPFSDKELQAFEDNINQRLEELRHNLSQMQEKREGLLDNGFQYNIGYGDDSKIAQELLRLNGLIENDMRQIQQLEAALMRIENRTYGIDVDTGEPIRKERLMAAPAALREIEPEDRRDGNPPGLTEKPTTKPGI